MNFAQFFISRPIFAIVISIFIMLAGGLAYRQLPVAQFPEVAPPTITVRASYPGATPDVVAETVAAPLEQEITGVENMLYMSSQNTADGNSVLTITFKLGTNLDTAQVLVQNRVALAEPRLPEEVRRIGIVTRKASPDLLMVVHLLSPNRTYDQLYISNYAIIQVKDQLARLDGVGDINLFGAREYSMRVWLDPNRLANLQLTVDDVLTAMRGQNVQVAGGIIGQPPLDGKSAFQLNVNTRGRLKEPDEFRDIIVKSGDSGKLVRLRDVADVQLAAYDYGVNSYLGDGENAVALVVSQRPGSNALATAEGIKAKMEELKRKFPPGLDYQVVYNPTEFVAESINAVYHTIFEAVILVVLVVTIFLQTWRASIIPILAIPVSLIGTFAAMYAFGFSLNNLSLFGLVLAIGIVVDDAIVVVENVERNLAGGLSPRAATRLAMREVSGAVIAIGLVLASVFVPTGFTGGITGQFYRQFALTIAIATIISVLVSLTLSPAMCALLLRSHHDPSRIDKIWNKSLAWLFVPFNWVFDRLSNGYAWLVKQSLRVGWLVLLGYGGLLYLTYHLFMITPTGFVPAVDQGYAICAIQMPDGASLERTDAVVRQVGKMALETPGILNVVEFVGFSGATQTNAPNAGALFPRFASFEERATSGLTAQKIVAELQKKVSTITDGFVIVIPPPPVRGIGSGGGFKMQLQDRAGLGAKALQDTAMQFMAKANQEPALTRVFSTFRASTPQLYADIDREKARMLNVPLNNVFNTLQVYLGSNYVNDFNLFGRVYRVRAQAKNSFRDDADDIAVLRTRNEAGAMVPLGSLLTVKNVAGPDRVQRYNLFPSAELQGDTKPGFSSGQAIGAMERLAKEVLPPGMDYEWTELAYQQKLEGNSSVFIFPLCVLFVFLVLAAQYESWSLPFAIILIVPMVLLSAIAGVILRGQDNNIMTQIGFVVLIGLACKNAILIVEFAKQLEEQGTPRREAVVQAARLRLRPILMTSFAFILGVVPLITGTGAGSELRAALGTAVFAGMIGVTAFGLFLTPVFYDVIRRLSGAKVSDHGPDADEKEIEEYLKKQPAAEPAHEDSPAPGAAIRPGPPAEPTS